LGCVDRGMEGDGVDLERKTVVGQKFSAVHGEDFQLKYIPEAGV